MKAVVFDWDLTLWNSWDIHLWLMRQTADELGMPRPEAAAIAREYHRPFFEHLTGFFEQDLAKILEVYLGFYRRVVGEKAYIYPGVREMLRSLKDQGYRVGVFSDKRSMFGGPELEQAGIGGLVDYVLFLEDGRPYKPDPTGLRQVLDALTVSPAETLYVGDSRQDVQCAHRAGVTSAAALWGSVDREGVLAHQPRYSLEQVEQVFQALGDPAPP